MAQAVTSWTQEEWTDFLAIKCHIKREKAHQIAARMAEQDFNTAKFESVVNEWMLNAKGCMDILLKIGFQDWLDILPFIAAIREHIENAERSRSTKRFVGSSVHGISSVPVNAPKVVHWLTTPNNKNNIGQSKKYLNIWDPEMTDASQFLDKVKKDFASSTSKRRFVARLSVSGLLAQFYDCNELTGEILQMRRIGVFDGCVIYTLSRGPNNAFDTNEDDCAEFY